MTRITELMSLQGRHAMVTGATGNIGIVIAETLAEMGADLVLVDRPGSSYESAIRQIRSGRDGTGVESIDCDLESQVERDRLVGILRDRGGHLNVLVNNAAFVGTSQLPGWSTAFEAQSTETWRRALEVNLTAAFDLAKGLAPVLRQSKGACIINMASLYGTSAPDYRLYEGTSMGNPAAYAASKGGLLQLTRWLATTLAPDVRVNAISPGGVFRNQAANFVERYAARTPLGRMATEDDLRGAIAYLASDMSAYVTGQNMAVDGGWAIW